MQNSNTEEYAVAYMRYSSSTQSENSISYQRSHISSYCYVKGIKIVREYIDRGLSGKTDRRAAFQQMIKDAQNKPRWNKVLIYNTNRFARNDNDALRYTNLLRDNDIEVISVTQEFDNSPAGKLMQTIAFALDAHYSNTNSLHTHSGMLEKAKTGVHCGGMPPLGYVVGTDRRLIVNEDEAKIVKMIFDMYEQNFSYIKIAQILNDAGYRTKAGKLFNKNSFNSILQQKKYIGVYSWNRARQRNSQHKRNSHAEKPTNEQVIIPDGCPSIISKEQFERVQEKLKSRARGKDRLTTKNNYMLSGLDILRCAKCGSFLVGNPRTIRGKKYTTYACPNHKSRGGDLDKNCPTKEIRTDYLDKAVAGFIINDLYNRSDLNRISDYLNHCDSYQELLNKRNGLEKAIANTLKVLESGCTDIITKKLCMLSDEKKAIDKEISRFESNSVELSKTNIRSVCKSLGQYLMNSSEPEAKRYIKNIVKEILVGNDDVTIKLNIA